MFERWFLAHPRQVGESYFGHLATAARFSGLLLAAGAACLVHALVPCLFQTTASRTVARLYDGMSRRAKPISESANGRPQVIAGAD